MFFAYNKSAASSPAGIVGGSFLDVVSRLTTTKAIGMYIYIYTLLCVCVCLEGCAIVHKSKRKTMCEFCNWLVSSRRVCVFVLFLNGVKTKKSTWSKTKNAQQKRTNILNDNRKKITTTHYKVLSGNARQCYDLPYKRFFVYEL